jgi:hypothetical protein
VVGDELEVYRGGVSGQPSPEAIDEWSADDVVKVLLGALRVAAIDATKGDEDAARWVAAVGPALVRRWLQPSAADLLAGFAEATPDERREMLPELRKMVPPNRTRRRRAPADLSGYPPPEPQGWRG